MNINIKNKKVIITAIGVIVLLVAVCVILFALSGDKEEYRNIQIYSIEGTATVERDGVGKIDAYAGMMMQSGDTVYTGKDSWLYFKMDADKYALLEPESIVRMESSGTSTDSKTVFHLETGSLVSRLDNKLSSDSVYEVNTPNSTMAVRGTVFRIEVTYDGSGVSYTNVYIFEGTVACQLIFPDGSKDEEIKPAEGGMKIRIRGDDTISEYILDDGTVDYSELPVEVLEFLRIAIEEGVELPISKEDVDALIAQKNATAPELCPCGIGGHTADDGMLHEIGDCGTARHYMCIDAANYLEENATASVEVANAYADSLHKKCDAADHYICDTENHSDACTPHEHTGGTATCVSSAICTVEGCGEAYGEKNTANHVGGTRVQGAKDSTCGAVGYTGDTYCQGCGVKTADGEEIPKLTTHTGGTATCQDLAACTVCGTAYGEKDPENHTGGTELRDVKDASCGAVGYTGDTYCQGCGVKTADGEEIPKLTSHSGGTATCQDLAVCTVCGTAYGEKDPENHTGGTELRDVKDATCGAVGYTGDTYCQGCGIKTADGEEIPKLTSHSGGTATCLDPAVCTVCGTAYGEKDPENHTGGTEVRDVKDATCGAVGYTGDTYCQGCGVKTADGEEIPRLASHSGGSATCQDQAVCTVCGESYGEKDPENHSSGTEVRNQKDASCGAVGYTGDTYCQGCGVKTSDGEEIPKLTSHSGGTEVRDAKDATCCDAGYTGDTYCITCGVKTAAGTSIPATGDHPAAACGASGHHAHDGKVHEAAPCGIEGHCVLDDLDHNTASCLFVTHYNCDGQTHDESCYDGVYVNIEIIVTDNGGDWSFTINGATYDKSAGYQDGEQYYFYFQARAGDTVTVSRTGTTGEFYAVSEVMDQVTGTNSVTFTVTEGAEEYVIMVVIQ